MASMHALPLRPEGVSFRAPHAAQRCRPSACASAALSASPLHKAHTRPRATLAGRKTTVVTRAVAGDQAWTEVRQGRQGSVADESVRRPYPAVRAHVCVACCLSRALLTLCRLAL
jgi:hypothetical protein